MRFSQTYSEINFFFGPRKNSVYIVLIPTEHLMHTFTPTSNIVISCVVYFLMVAY